MRHVDVDGGRRPGGALLLGVCDCVPWMVSTTGSVSATTVGCGCLNAISDLGGSESGRRGSVFRVGPTREGWRTNRRTVGWSCVAAVDDARGGVDVIHGTEVESVSGVCMMGVVLTCYGRHRRRRRGQRGLR